MTYDAYLGERRIGGTRLRFPMTPPVNVRHGVKEQIVSLIERGDFNIPRGGQPVQISLSSFFPGSAHRGGLTIPEWQAPADLITQLYLWMATQDHPATPLTFLVPGTPVQLDCTISSLDYAIDKGSWAGDITFELTLKEYRDVLVFTEAELVSLAQAKPDASAANPDAAGEPRPEDPPPGSYTVKEGDSLYAIAALLYGDGSRWEEIYAANTDTIGPDPNLITPGMELIIPGGQGAEDGEEGGA